MRKCLLLVALLIGAQWTGLKAQSLFDAPDTVCIRQSVQLTSHAAGASSYYWGFCSGYLRNNPVVTNQGIQPGFSIPSSMEVAKDGNNYFGFVLNRGSKELLRLAYGNSLGNVPVVTNFGNLSNTLPAEPSSLYITQDAGRWYLFATGGSTLANSTMARIDFGTSLNNAPNSVNFGNPGNLLSGPRGIFVSADAGKYYGYVVNSANSRLIRLDFGTNISLTPAATSLGNVGNLAGPSDIAAALETGNWYLLITNQTSNSITRVALGNSLANAPQIAPATINLGTFGGRLFGPTAISLVKDCGSTYAFITDAVSNELTRIDIPTLDGTYSATNLGGFGSAFISPADISRVIRERDNLYAYVVNAGNNSLTQVAFPQCTNSSIPSSTSANPPAVSYDVPGLYNVILAINEGLPNAAVECQQIRVLPIPPITLSHDTTICQGDSVHLIVQSNGAISFTWSPDYNISGLTGQSVYAFPEYSLNYFLHIPYYNGCIVDTSVRIDVLKIKADAGPDRTISDGATTVLGGPYTTIGSQYTYQWTPNQFINDPFVPTPTATPSFNLTYYLQVSDINGCVDIDTVVIRVGCNELTLPNAFVPESKRGVSSRFGLLNRQIVQLNYFRIFDRWGREVFTTTDVTRQWDGMVNGDPAPAGVYVWEADGFCISGKRLTSTGNVTLIR